MFVQMNSHSNGEGSRDMSLCCLQAHCKCTEDTLCCRASGGRTLPLCSLTGLPSPPSLSCYSFPTLCAPWWSLALPRGKNRISHMSGSLCDVCVRVSLLSDDVTSSLRISLWKSFFCPRWMESRRMVLCVSLFVLQLKGISECTICAERRYYI